MKQSNLWDREESAYMNEIDRQFAALVAEIQGLSEKELYHRIRANFVIYRERIDCNLFVILVVYYILSDYMPNYLHFVAFVKC